MKAGLVAVLVLACACSRAPAASSVSTRAGGDAPAEPHAGHETVWTLEGLAAGAVRLPDLGEHRRKVSTRSADAQAFFDQGLALTYGYNHDEAARSFAHAARLDPECAMCWWGAAYTLGPNYNSPMFADRSQAAWDAITRAREAAAGATPVEAALVDALSKRYAGPAYVDPAAMEPYNIAYADAMREVAKRFPDDDDVQALFAEALMNVAPWKLWTAAGDPSPLTPEIVATLETVLARAPTHPGANHYYIHAIEASKHPERALAAADRLPGLIPGAGHIVHMPAHIYQRVGRYADAVDANRKAIEVDERYLRTVDPPGHYAMYVAHNHGFLAYSAAMEGRSEEALASSRKAAETTPRDLVCGMPGMDFFLSEPLLVEVRFGRWQDVLAEPRPPERYLVLVALWHHARGMAFAATGRREDARAEVAALRAIESSIADDMLAGLNRGRDVLELAAQIVEARIAEVERAPDAIARWRRAVTLEDALAYNEPADWFYPVRHYLGAALLDAGRPADAESVFRADLERNPANGWALFGLWKSLAARKHAAAAKQAQADFRKAWARADIELSRSGF